MVLDAAHLWEMTFPELPQDDISGALLPFGSDLLW